MPRRTRNTAFSRPITIPDPASCAMESLDLHGYRKDAAIRAVTDFLEQVVSISPTLQKSRWVTIITGTGQHSPDGPVLRTAVEKLLLKRAMQFTIHNNKGGFLVNAHSGHVLYANAPPRDSKVILRTVNRHLEQNRQCPKRSLEQPLTTPPQTKMIHHENDPTPCDLAQDDALVEHAKEISRKERYTEVAMETKDRQALTRAVSESLLEQESFQECQNQDDEALRKALILSKQSRQNIVAMALEEEQLLQQAISESKRHLDHYNSINLDDDDDERIAFLKMNTQDTNMKELVRQSETTIAGSDAELKHILSLSAEECLCSQSPSLDEERLLQQAMQLSLQEFTNHRHRENRMEARVRSECIRMV